MVNVKTRIVIYHYGSASAAEAKELAVKLRSKGGNARTIDATNFADIEDADKIEYVGDIPEAVKETIENAYRGVPMKASRSTASSGESEINIPDNWEELSFPELQKLAAALTDEAVRSKEQAISIIEAELERREEPDSEEDDQFAHLDGMTKAQLLEYAEDNEVDLGEAKNKAEILAAIRAAIPKE